MQPWVLLRQNCPLCKDRCSEAHLVPLAVELRQPPRESESLQAQYAQISKFVLKARQDIAVKRNLLDELTETQGELETEIFQLVIQTERELDEKQSFLSDLEAQVQMLRKHNDRLSKFTEFTDLLKLVYAGKRIEESRINWDLCEFINLEINRLTKLARNLEMELGQQLNPKAIKEPKKNFVARNPSVSETIKIRTKKPDVAFPSLKKADGHSDTNKRSLEQLINAVPNIKSFDALRNTKLNCELLSDSRPEVSRLVMNAN